MGASFNQIRSECQNFAKDVARAILVPTKISNSDRLIKGVDLAKAGVMGLAIIVGAAAFSSGSFVGLFIFGAFAVAAHDAYKIADNIKATAHLSRGDNIQFMNHITLGNEKNDVKARAGFGTIFAKPITNYLLDNFFDVANSSI